MSSTRTTTAEKILNRAAIEVGLEPTVDPFASEDPSFQQLIALLNAAGEELVISYQWELLTRAHQFTTSSTDSGDYDLPADFMYMIPQTGWELANQMPLFGPMSAQDWTYLKGRKLVSQTIYASFRLREGLFSLFPQPPPNGLDINFEYQSRNWVQDTTTMPVTEKDEVTLPSDIVLFDKTLITRYLKVKYLEAKGLDSTAASDDFTQVFSFLTGLDAGVGEILNAGRARRGVPYLDSIRNTPDTNFGVP